MHFQYIRFRNDVMAPGRGSNVSASYRVGDVAQGIPTTHMHAIYEKGDWIVLEDKKGLRRMTPRENVIDADEETPETKAYREKEATRLRAAAKEKEAQA